MASAHLENAPAGCDVTQLTGPASSKPATTGDIHTSNPGDTFQAMIIPDISFSLPLGVWILTSFFRAMPWELEQAALAQCAVFEGGFTLGTVVTAKFSSRT